MELRKSIGIRKVVVFAYFLLLAGYLIVGFSPAPAEAAVYEISAELKIPTIGLISDVTTLKLRDGKLDTPDAIVGSFSRANNKTFLVGHAATVFKNLKNLEVGNEIVYDNTTFVVQKTEILAKAKISMNELLRETETETLVVMTCSGEALPGGDATHRLIITATIKS